MTPIEKFGAWRASDHSVPYISGVLAFIWFTSKCYNIPFLARSPCYDYPVDWTIVEIYCGNTVGNPWPLPIPPVNRRGFIYLCRYNYTVDQVLIFTNRWHSNTVIIIFAVIQLTGLFKCVRASIALSRRYDHIYYYLWSKNIYYYYMHSCRISYYYIFVYVTLVH